jgi:hypothetical protein
MDLSRIDTAIGLLSLVPICIMYVTSAYASPLGALSLPCLTMLTSFIYFYMMPAVALASGDEGLFGMYIGDLSWTHTAVLLYALGAIAAFATYWRVLAANPACSYPWDRQFNFPVFLMLWGIAGAGITAQWWLGKLNIAAEEDYKFGRRGHEPARAFDPSIKSCHPADRGFAHP